jgi:tetratricopeptide (TPR) repeat protein
MESQQVSASRFSGVGHKAWKIIGKSRWVLLVISVLIFMAAIWQYQRVSANNNWKKATDYFRRADYDSAAKILKGVSMPKTSERLNVYAQTMLATRRLDKAAEAYQKLYESNKDPFAKLVLGNIYNQQKKYDSAAKIYKELIKANPTYVQAYVNLATLYKLQNDTDKAIKTADDGVKSNPNNTVLAELLVSLTMDDKNSDKYKDAVSYLKKLNPSDPLLIALEQ